MESQRDSASKPRVPRNELPWVISARAPQLRRSCAVQPKDEMCGIERAANSGTTPLGLAMFCGCGPRVARSSQPWAGGRNPFGIGARFAREKLTWLLKSSLILSVKGSQWDGLAVGEVVTLKSGGPPMTVQQLDLNEDFEEIVICK